MSDPESIEVPRSEETPVETPSEPTETVVPAEQPPEEPPKPVEEFELPDGRKVDAETLAREWKDNFMPDYTHKSQELARIKTPEKPIETTPDPLESPDFIPQSWGEAARLIEERALARVEEKERTRIEQQRERENQVAAQLDEVKKLDSSVNENTLFQHATKYGFRNLKVAHQNMKDMNEMAKKVQQTTVKDIAKRNDPVSSTPGATGAKLNPDDFRSATDYLRAFKGQ